MFLIPGIFAAISLMPAIACCWSFREVVSRNLYATTCTTVFGCPYLLTAETSFVHMLPATIPARKIALPPSACSNRRFPKIMSVLPDESKLTQSKRLSVARQPPANLTPQDAAFTLKLHFKEKRMPRIVRWIAPVCVALALSLSIHAQDHAKTNPEAREIFQQLIEINTTDSIGNVTRAAEAMAQRLLSAGFPEKDVIVAGPNDRKKNLVARFRGTGKKKPILFIGHLDVVEARREDWTTDPFELVEKDGYFYGRGTQDMKEGDAILVMAFLRLKREGFVPDRDLILALTADEEGGKANGIAWLLKEHKDW